MKKINKSNRYRKQRIRVSHNNLFGQGKDKLDVILWLTQHVPVIGYYVNKGGYKYYEFYIADRLKTATLKEVEYFSSQNSNKTFILSETATKSEQSISTVDFVSGRISIFNRCHDKGYFFCLSFATD